MTTMQRNRQRGVTLIEILVVMVIIALFATIVSQRVFPSLDRGMQTAAKAQITELETALDMFRLDVGRYPTVEEGLAALQQAPANAPNWDGPYLRKDIPVDPWGRPYIYRYPGEHGDFDLISLGGDGQEGGEGINADIVSWQ